jgi:CBS domain containing-hemolysin-like protein
VSDVLTPRVDIVAVSKDDTKEEIANKFFDSGFSRFPVYDGTIDSIVGIINEKDFNNYVIHRNKEVNDIIKPVSFVPHSMELFKLLKLLQKNKSHMAIVADDYSGTMGIVTLEDILEELVGEIRQRNYSAFDLRRGEQIEAKPGGRSKEYEFEGYLFYGPMDNAAYLTALYGPDYMIPPEEDARGGHPAAVIELEQAYQDREI